MTITCASLNYTSNILNFLSTQFVTYASFARNICKKKINYPSLVDKQSIETFTFSSFYRIY